VLYQLIADHLDVGFVNNRMARYFAAPVLGAMLHGRAGGGHDFSLVSDQGRTRGDSAPHEFSWFWHYHIDFRAHDDLTNEELALASWKPVGETLEAIAAHFGRPLVIKNINFVVYQIAWLKRLLPAAKFIWIRRDQSFTVQSILRVREEQYGDRRIWWSVRPRDEAHWLSKPAVEQVVHQVKDVSRAIEEGFEHLEASDRLELEYEELMERPAEILKGVAQFIGTRVVDDERLDSLVLRARNEKTLDDETWAAIHTALAL
jgi:hypothetical protein